MNAPSPTVLNASTGFLSDEDLRRLTGYEAGQRQRIEGWLKRHAYVYQRNARGEVLVLWEHVREKLCQAGEEERQRPNFEAYFAKLDDYHAKRGRARSLPAGKDSP
ncbi:MAG: DUF4224 domain-containing protein [Gammaproteobacteria bacterium]